MDSEEYSCCLVFTAHKALRIMLYDDLQLTIPHVHMLSLWQCSAGQYC